MQYKFRLIVQVSGPSFRPFCHTKQAMVRRLVECTRIYSLILNFDINYKLLQGYLLYLPLHIYYLWNHYLIIMIPTYEHYLFLIFLRYI